MKHRMKIDINNWCKQVDYILSNSRSKIVREKGFEVSIGLDLILSYLRKIAARAIELNDEYLIEILKDMDVLKEEE